MFFEARRWYALIARFPHPKYLYNLINMRDIWKLCLECSQAFSNNTVACKAYVVDALFRGSVPMSASIKESLIRHMAARILRSSAGC
jgi:hypothetical protein